MLLAADANQIIQGEAAPIEWVKAAEGDSDDGLKKFRMNAYNGGKLRLSNYYTPVVIDLASLSATAKSRPILRDHDPSHIVGHSTNIAINAKSVIVEGVISGGNGDADQVIASAKNGFPWQASVGVQPGKLHYVAAGESITVNGRTFDGPVYVARQGRLREVSFVALGADDSTSVKVAAAASEESLMGFEAWLEAKGFSPDDLNEEQRTSLKAMYDAEIKAQAGSQDDDDDDDDNNDAGDVDASGNTAGVQGVTVPDIAAQLRKAAAEETSRINKIRELTKDHPKLEAKAISEGWDATRTELEVLRASRNTQAPAAHFQQSGRSAAALEASVCASAGLSREFLLEQYGEKTMEAAESPAYRSAGIVTVLHACVQAAGMSCRMDKIDNDVIRAALRADQQMIQAAGGGGGFSTVSLSGILSNVANKLLLAAYNAVETVVPFIAQQVDTRDFKQFHSYRLVGGEHLEEIGPDGEIKHTKLDEDAFSNQLKTWARMIALTRTMMINDDLNAFQQIPTLMGRAAALTREKAVFELLLDNSDDFFHADNGNLLEGTAGALSIGGLTLLEELFLNQTDSNGDPILLSPNRLLVPTGLKVTAEQLYGETRVNETTAEGSPSPANNPHAGKFAPATSPYLNAQNLVGSSSTGWYMFGDPNVVPALQVAYLQGRRAPTIESAETDFNTLGMQWRAYYDFGVAKQDPRGAAHATGVA